MAEKFLLKDHLFNPQKVEKIAAEIVAVYPRFNRDSFVSMTLSRFAALELKARISWIATTLKHHLPDPFDKACPILLQALPEPCNPALSDNNFGDFIYAPYSEFVAQNGCTAQHLDLSLEALKAITTRFSAEDAIRTFINVFPDQTLARLLEWAHDAHYHVRRLASEGTRPKLPWAQKINIPPEKALPILDKLHADPTRFVTRSVANHLNDISKFNPELVLTTLQKWADLKHQHHKEIDYMTRHALRTLIKKGHAATLGYIGIYPPTQVTIENFRVLTPHVEAGKSLLFEFSLVASEDVRVLVDYIVHFKNKSGGYNQKVYKLGTLSLKKGESKPIQKHHPLKATMSTRTLYEGLHWIELQLNGQKMNRNSFYLVSSRESTGRLATPLENMHATNTVPVLEI